MSDFDRALAFVLHHEGGFVDHPDDPGGATNMGITQATYDAWRGNSTRSVQTIERGEVEAIYRDNYWTGAPESQPWPLSLVIFDARVQHGKWAKIVQRACVDLGADVVVDGAWGPKSQAALDACRSAHGAHRVTLAVVGRRLDYYNDLKHWDSFSEGWAQRVALLCVETAKE